MSGGSMEYFYCRLEEYSNVLGDKELNDLVKDLVKVFHDKEWFDSADYSEGTYNKTVAEFKAKWFGRSDEERIKSIVNDKVKEIYQTLGMGYYCKDCKHWKAESDTHGRCKENRWLTHGYEYGCDDWEKVE